MSLFVTSVVVLTAATCARQAINIVKDGFEVKEILARDENVRKMLSNVSSKFKRAPKAKPSTRTRRNPPKA